MKKANLSRAVMLCCVIMIGASCVFGQDWPQWRGANRDGKVTGFEAPQQWPTELKLRWKTPVGTGDATPALVGDKLYVFTRLKEPASRMSVLKHRDEPASSETVKR